MFKYLNFFFKKMHLSSVRFAIEIFFPPHFSRDNITDGDTPPAPITKALFLLILSTLSSRCVLHTKYSLGVKLNVFRTSEESIFSFRPSFSK